MDPFHFDDWGWEIRLMTRQVSGYLLAFVLSVYYVPYFWYHHIAFLSLNLAKFTDKVHRFHRMRACLIHFTPIIVKEWTSVHKHSVVADAFMALNVWATSWIWASLVLPHKALLIKRLWDGALEVASLQLRSHIEQTETFRDVVMQKGFFLLFLFFLITVRSDCRYALFDGGPAELRWLMVLGLIWLIY